MNHIVKTIIRYVLAISIRFRTLYYFIPCRLRNTIGRLLYRSLKQELSNGERCYHYIDHFEATPQRVLVFGWFVSHSGLKKITLTIDDRVHSCAFECGFPRPEIGCIFTQFNDSHKCGFTVSREFSPPLALGSHFVEITFISNDGGVEILKKNITVVDHYLDYLKDDRHWTAQDSDRNTDHQIAQKPWISILFFPENSDKNQWVPILEALARQTDSGFEIIVVQNHGIYRSEEEFKYNNGEMAAVTAIAVEDLNGILDQRETPWLGFLGPRSLPYPNCLAEIEKIRRQNPDSRLIYGDEDRHLLNAGDRHFFKPDFAPELLLSTNYIGELFFIQRDLYREIGGIRDLGVQEAFHDLLLRACEATHSVIHVPKLLHSVTGQEVSDHVTGAQVIRDALARRNVNGEVHLRRHTGRAIWGVQPKVSDAGKVSIIILTAYQDAEQNLIPCLRSICDLSTYSNYEILLVDNSQGRLSRPDVLNAISDRAPVNIIEYEDAFNFPRMNNLAASQAQGQYLVLLNDDIAINTPDWMEQMMGLTALPQVGIVGCKLLFPDRNIQHAGVIVLSSGPTHPFRFAPSEFTGYNNLLAGLMNWSAVTFACALIPRDVYDQVGGMTERLPVEYNDVDFCLKAATMGYRSVYTPFVDHFHKESASRCFTGQVGGSSDLEVFWKNWPDLVKDGDPFFNPNLRFVREYFTFNPKKVT